MCTGTNVYKLVDKVGRKKREAAERWVISRHSIRSGYITKSSSSFTSYFGRPRRDIDDSLTESHGARVSFGAVGCPQGARHNPEELDCICPINTTYSLESFQCEHAQDVHVIAIEEEDLEESGPGSSNADVIKSSFCFLFSVFVCFSIFSITL